MSHELFIVANVASMLHETFGFLVNRVLSGYRGCEGIAKKNSHGHR